MKSGWPEIIATSVFAGLAGASMSSHEPWADEAQAWQLARTLSLHDLFGTYLHYEGSPGLWHLLLWCLIRLHVSYTGLHWICAIVAIVSACLFIFESPFPRWLRLSLPFGYFLIFQYAVNARSYVLVPPMLFLLAWIWKRSPLAVAVTLGLLANLSLHAAVLSGGLAVVYFIDCLLGRIVVAPGRRWAWMAIVAGFYAAAIWTAWPKADAIVPSHAAASTFARYAAKSLLWGVGHPAWLAAMIWLAIALCLAGRKRVYYLIPVLFFAVFSGLVYCNWWHAGLLIPLILALLWMTWPPAQEGVNEGEAVGRAGLVLLAAVQIVWAAYAIRYDALFAYSPSLATRDFLKPYVERGTAIAIASADESGLLTYNAIEVLPYFERNIFVNLPQPFWLWSVNNPVQAGFAAVVAARPQMVLVYGYDIDTGDPARSRAPLLRRLYNSDYRFTHAFCGSMPIGLESGGNGCTLIFETNP